MTSAAPGRPTPARVRRAFRDVRAETALSDRTPNPADPAPDAHPAPASASLHPGYDVEKTVKRDRTITAHQQRDS